MLVCARSAAVTARAARAESARRSVRPRDPLATFTRPVLTRTPATVAEARAVHASRGHATSTAMARLGSGRWTALPRSRTAGAVSSSHGGGARVVAVHVRAGLLQ